MNFRDVSEEGKLIDKDGINVAGRIK